MGGLGQHPPRGSSCSPTPPTAPESTQSPTRAPSRPSRHFIIDPPFPRPFLGLGRGGGSQVGVRRVDKGQLYFSVVAVVALGWEKEEDCEAKLFLRNDLGFSLILIRRPKVDEGLERCPFPISTGAITELLL